MSSPINPIASLPAYPVDFQAHYSSSDISSCEANLSAFINWILRQSSTGQYSPDVAIRLLDRAWEAQKQLWQLRHQV
ncbi:hypothetical protein K9N68_21705 [Kovacikia minuta CCNUW1]|uniref:hypothetical protein n=1 Tax=Kovacikia minuta TaxID=2931930 RepID=UPI001CCB8F06|nr:hypothetical protein [Kovacikia minuta]UBF24306.1 hypothetical protein K9N68_21705 [Kovacikia minuta CCNUW1]